MGEGVQASFKACLMHYEVTGDNKEGYTLMEG